MSSHTLRCEISCKHRKSNKYLWLADVDKYGNVKIATKVVMLWMICALNILFTPKIYLPLYFPLWMNMIYLYLKKKPLDF